MKQIIKDFRSRKEDILRYIEKDGIERLSSFCATVGIPLIAAYTYILEEYPEHKELCNQKIEMLCEFYGYKKD